MSFCCALGGAGDGVEAFGALLGGAAFIEEQFGPEEDAGEGGAEFVGDGGEELILGVIGGFGLAFGFAEDAFGEFAFGGVDKDAAEAEGDAAAGTFAEDDSAPGFDPNGSPRGVVDAAHDAEGAITGGVFGALDGADEMGTVVGVDGFEEGFEGVAAFFVDVEELAAAGGAGEAAISALEFPIAHAAGLEGPEEAVFEFAFGLEGGGGR